MGTLNYAPASGLTRNNPAAGAGPRHNPVRGRWCLALPVLLLAGVAQAAVQYVQIPAAQAHATITHVGGVPVQPFDLAPQAAIPSGTAGVTTIPGVPASVTGSLTVAPGVRTQTMPGTWNSVWANGYTGPLFHVTPRTATLTLPPHTTAFHVFAEPDTVGTLDITATTDSGATSGAVTVVATAQPPAANSIPGFGFFTTTQGEFIQTITINASGGFAIGRFGMAQAPAAPASNVAAVPVLGGWGLGLLGALVAGLGLVQRRRRA